MTANSEEMRERRWIIVGAGRMGRALGLLAHRLNIRVAATWNRTESRAAVTNEILGGHSDALSGDLAAVLKSAEPPRVIWLTVVDDAVVEMASQLAPYVDPEDLVIHTSGVASSDSLREAGLVDCHIGSIHVLQAITEPERAVRSFGASTWSVEGDDKVVAFGRELLAEIGVEPLVIGPEARVPYHAAAVTASNLMVALMDAAFEMAEHAGLERGAAREILLALARSSVENLASQQVDDALSGPVARGDRRSVDLHRQGLARLDDQNLLDIYDALTERAKRLVPEQWPGDGD